MQNDIIIPQKIKFNTNEDLFSCSLIQSNEHHFVIFVSPIYLLRFAGPKW
jgi:hypothetical protein